MSHDHHHHAAGHGDYERSDIGISGVLYFLAGLFVFGLLSYGVIHVLYRVLDKHNEAEQAPVSPLVKNAPGDTRKLPAEYAGPAGYEKYLEQKFPAPQLEIDERNQLDKIRQDEAGELSRYEWIDQKAGTVRIPIDRAMELVAQRGLPVRSASGSAGSSSASAPLPEKPAAESKKSKGKKK